MSNSGVISLIQSIDPAIIMSEISVIVAIISIFVSMRSNKIANKTNKLSYEANKLSYEANKLSHKNNDLFEEQNEISKKALSLKFKEGMSEFDVELQEIHFDNDYYLMDNIDDAIMGGTAKCTFKIKNRTAYTAYRVGFDPHFFEIRSDTQDLHQNEEKIFTITIQLLKLSGKTPFYDIKIGEEGLKIREYNFKQELFWENEHKKCQCVLRFEVRLQEKKCNNLVQTEILPTSNNKVFLNDYNID